MSILKNVFHLWQLIKASAWQWRGDKLQISDQSPSRDKWCPNIPQITLCGRWVRTITRDTRAMNWSRKRKESSLLYVFSRWYSHNLVSEKARNGVVNLLPNNWCTTRTNTLALKSVISWLTEEKIIPSASLQYYCWQTPPVCVCTAWAWQWQLCVIPVTNTAFNLQALPVPTSGKT